MVTYLGSLVHLCCSEGGTLQTNITGMCGECSQCMDLTGFAPLTASVLSQSTLRLQSAQAPGCSAGELSKAGPGFCALPRSKLLRFRFSTKAQSWLGLCLVPFPGPSSLGNVVFGEHTVPGGLCILITSLVPATQFPRYAERAPSQVCCVSPLESRSLAVTLLADVNHPGSQEDLVNNWEPAHSLMENAISGAEIAPHLLALVVSHLPLCLCWGDGPVHSWLSLLWYLLNPLFCEPARLCLRLELFTGKFSLSPSCWGFSPWDLEVTNLKEGHSDNLLQGLTSLFLQSSLFIEVGTKNLEYTASRACMGLTPNQ